MPTSFKPILKQYKKELPKPALKSSKPGVSKTKAKEYRKPFYKLLAGNGTHQAIGEFMGTVHRDPVSNQLIITFTDEVSFPVKVTGHNNNDTFKNKCIGTHYFRGYPTCKNGIIVKITITSIDPKNRLFSYSLPRFEYWHFRGLWTVQETITVQRSIDNLNTLNTARETGFIKKYKFRFINYSAHSSSLTPGYVYTIMAQRIGNFFYIETITPFCCPLSKPKTNKRR